MLLTPRRPGADGSIALERIRAGESRAFADSCWERESPADRAVFLLVAAALEHIFNIENQPKGHPMLNAAILFLIIALVAAVLGFGGIAGTAAGIAKILFFVFLVLALISFLTGRRGTTI